MNLSCVSTLYLITLIMVLQYVHGYRRHAYSLGRVITPRSVPKHFSMPASCKNKGMNFCFSNESYPIAEVEKLLRDIRTLEVFGINQPSHMYSNRQGDCSVEADCPTIVPNFDEYIHYIVDENGYDRVVVQLKNKFQQYFTVRWCAEEGLLSHRTTHFENITINKFNISCETQYIHFDVLVLSREQDNKGNYKMEIARTKSGIPVCCACKHKLKFDF